MYSSTFNGENVYVRSTSSASITYTPGEASATWYSEISSYVFGPTGIGADGFPIANAAVRDFTQMIWRSSRFMCTACAKGTLLGNPAVFVVSHYSPAGNIPGSYLENVPPPL